MALWTPANLSGSKLHRWIKGTSFSTSGGTITGGTTSDSSASTITKVSTNWPTYNASGLNGYSTITSGGSNLMSIPVDIDYDCSVFVVVKPSALSSYHNVYEQSGDKSPTLWIDSSNRFSMNGAGAVIEPSTPTADGSTWRVVSTINRSSGTRSEERIDGTSKGTAGESVGSLNVGTGLTLKLLGRSDGNGLQGDVVINGAKFNGVMPAMTQLTDQQIADALTFVRQRWHNDAAPVSTSPVPAIHVPMVMVCPEKFMT